MKFPVGISKRHLHLSKETYEKLFGTDEIAVRNYLKQPGEFASTVTVDIKWGNKIIERLRLVGPLRAYDQVELCQSDADILGVNPPRRKSGEVSGSLPITLIGPKGEVTISEGLIMADKHIHLNEELAEELNLVDDEIVKVNFNGEELFEASVKIKNPAVPELHIDFDEEQIYNVHQDQEVEIVKCGQ